MKEKVLIPHRGIIALDIIHSLNSLGLETVLMHSPEDALSLPVKLADQSFKFYSSRLEDSYLDMEAIIEKALEIGANRSIPAMAFSPNHRNSPGCARRTASGSLAPTSRFWLWSKTNSRSAVSPRSWTSPFCLIRN